MIETATTTTTATKTSHRNEWRVVLIISLAQWCSADELVSEWMSEWLTSVRKYSHMQSDCKCCRNYVKLTFDMFNAWVCRRRRRRCWCLFSFVIVIIGRCLQLKWINFREKSTRSWTVKIPPDNWMEKWISEGEKKECKKQYETRKLCERIHSCVCFGRFWSVTVKADNNEHLSAD